MSSAQQLKAAQALPTPAFDDGVSSERFAVVHAARTIARAASPRRSSRIAHARGSLALARECHTAAVRLTHTPYRTPQTSERRKAERAAEDKVREELAKQEKVSLSPGLVFGTTLFVVLHENARARLSNTRRAAFLAALSTPQCAYTSRLLATVAFVRPTAPFRDVHAAYCRGLWTALRVQVQMPTRLRGDPSFTPLHSNARRSFVRTCIQHSPRFFFDSRALLPRSSHRRISR
jgi:hypothetical protein